MKKCPLSSSVFAVALIAIAALLLLFAGCGRKEPSRLEQGLALFRQNQLEQALPLLQEAVAEFPDNPDAHAWMAETLRRLGKKGQAVESARRALELEPCHSFAHDVMAAVHSPMYGKWEGADPESTWYHLTAAATCGSTGWTRAMSLNSIRPYAVSIRSAGGEPNRLKPPPGTSKVVRRW